MTDEQIPQTSAGAQLSVEPLLTAAPQPNAPPPALRDSSRNPTPNYRRRGEAYEEMKRLIIFAGIFFLFIIIFILLKFQVSLDDVFKWSPVIWLVGVVICGILMNVCIQLQKYLKQRRTKRLQEQQNLLFSLHLPTSFPCLAPPPHTEACCRCDGGLFSSPLLTARRLQQNQQMLFRDALLARVANDMERSASADVYADQLEQHLLAEYGLLASLADQQGSSGGSGSFVPRLPTYEQVMKGAKTWLLSKTASATQSTSEQRQELRRPPEYSPLVITDVAGPSTPGRRIMSPLHLDVDHGQPVAGEPLAANIPPPAYDESVSIAQSVRLMSPQLAQLDEIENGACIPSSIGTPTIRSDDQRRPPLIDQNVERFIDVSPTIELAAHP